MVSVKEKDFWIEFIEKYQSFPCLWDVYAKEYSNKILREQALDELVEKCKEIKVDADKDFVRKRIANMRTAFSREFKKLIIQNILVVLPMIFTKLLCGIMTTFYF